MGYEFILYRHGPFSFDLRDELTSLRADNLFLLELQPPPYGPKLNPTDAAERLQSIFPKTFAKYDRHLDFVAGAVGDRGVSDLEALATAWFVAREEKPETSAARVAEKLRALKPHISGESAEAAVKEIGELRNKWSSVDR
jgi:hypothetical protein